MYRSTCGLPITMDSACVRVVATLKRYIFIII